MMDAIEANEKTATLFDAVVGLYHAVHELAVQTNFHPAVDKRLREVCNILIDLERTPAPQAPEKADVSTDCRKVECEDRADIRYWQGELVKLTSAFIHDSIRDREAAYNSGFSAGQASKPNDKPPVMSIAERDHIANCIHWLDVQEDNPNGSRCQDCARIYGKFGPQPNPPASPDGADEVYDKLQNVPGWPKVDPREAIREAFSSGRELGAEEERKRWTAILDGWVKAYEHRADRGAAHAAVATMAKGIKAALEKPHE